MCIINNIIQHCHTVEGHKTPEPWSALFVFRKPPTFGPMPGSWLWAFELVWSSAPKVGEALTWFPLETVHLWPGSWRCVGSGGGGWRCWFLGTWLARPPGRGHSAWLPNPPRSARASRQEPLWGERGGGGEVSGWLDDGCEVDSTSDFVIVSQQWNQGPHTQRDQHCLVG